jgi:hypothetical protein
LPKVARGIFLFPEDRLRDQAGRVIDRTDQDEPGCPAFEPVVAAAIELEQEALGGHPWSAAAMGWCPALAGAGPARGPQDPAQARSAEHDRLALGQGAPAAGPPPWTRR